jgi:protein involved in plasmid replication-relaxation
MLLEKIQPMQKKVSIVLMPRDRALLAALYECRVMTLQQAAGLHFDEHGAYTRKRVSKLKQAGLLRERPRRRSEPSVLHLTAAGWELLQKEGQLDHYPPLSAAVFRKRARVSDFTLQHELAIIDIKAAFVRALKSSDRFKLHSFCTWPRLLEFTTQARSSGIYLSQEVTVRPDGFIRIREVAEGSQYEICFYLEVDRSTESQETLVRKSVAYLEYYRSGRFAIREGGHPEEYRKFPFRLLIVCRSPERQYNILSNLLESDPPVFTHAWITTFSEIRADPMGKIWLRPVDIRSRNAARTIEGTDVATASRFSILDN